MWKRVQEIGCTCSTYRDQLDGIKVEVVLIGPQLASVARTGIVLIHDELESS